MGRGAAVARGQGGFTLVEGVICVLVAALGISAVALGLLTSVKVDNSSNEQQRLNLAMRTFTESAAYSRPSAGAVCGATDPAPSTANLATVPASHARQVLQSALAKGDLQRWIDRRVMFTVTDVEYGAVVSNTSTTLAQEQFVSAAVLAACPAPVSPPPSYPVIRISVTACLRVQVAGESQCQQGSPVLDAQVIKRGGRTAA